MVYYFYLFIALPNPRSNNTNWHQWHWQDLVCKPLGFMVLGLALSDTMEKIWKNGCFEGCFSNFSPQGFKPFGFSSAVRRHSKLIINLLYLMTDSGIKDCHPCHPLHGFHGFHGGDDWHQVSCETYHGWWWLMMVDDGWWLILGRYVSYCILLGLFGFLGIPMTMTFLWDDISDISSGHLQRSSVRHSQGGAEIPGRSYDVTY